MFRVKKSISKYFNFSLFLALFLCVIIVCIVINPSKYINICLNGILVFGKNILPALLPFIFFTKLLTSTGYAMFVSKKFSNVTKKIYNSPAISSYVFLMSILSGYPLGAKITADLFNEGIITREEAHRICSFTSNSGPMFIVGTVGAMLHSTTAGYIILISHILASLLNGLIYRKYSPKYLEILPKKISKNQNKDNVLSDCMQNSILSVLMIGGFICVFFIITEIFISLKLFSPIIFLLEKFGVPNTITESILCGILEITNGCLKLSSLQISLALKTIVSSFIISFGGLAVAFQGLAFLNDFKISKKYYFLQKLTHATLSCLITIILCFVFSI